MVRQLPDNATLEVAQTIGDRIQATIGPQQDRMEAMLIGLGADEIVRVRAVNMLVANIPGSALAALEAESDVTRISLMKPGDVAANAAEVDREQMSTSAFWNALYLGNGESVAALDTGLHTAHKHFASLTLDNSPIHVPAASCAANDLTGADQNGHGTSVASIVTAPAPWLVLLPMVFPPQPLVCSGDR
jgi:subtilisin family serine protease